MQLADVVGNPQFDPGAWVSAAMVFGKLGHDFSTLLEDCYRLNTLTESFSTERPSLSTMLAVIGQIEVMRCCTARSWVPRKAGRG